MTVPHFFVDRMAAGESVLLSPEDSRHALRSLRLRPGEAVTVADGLGQWGEGTLFEEVKGRARIAVDSVQAVAQPKPLVHVILAPPKGGRLAWAVQKLAEIGADAVSIVETERTVRQWADLGRAAGALARFQRIALGASMQARRPFPLTFGDSGEGLEEVWGAASSMPGDHLVLLHGPGRTSLRASLPEDPRMVVLLVGPEGGFTDAEVDRAGERGVTTASLGPTTLRTETAAIVGAALVLAHYGRLG